MGYFFRPKENEMIAVMEDIYDQIVRQGLLTARKSFTYSYLDPDF